MSHDFGAIDSFVSALISGGVGIRKSDRYAIVAGAQTAPAGAIIDLISSGALSGGGNMCRANKQTPGWLRRARLGPNGFSQQHQLVTADALQRQVNVAESPLTRLAVTSKTSKAFLDSHHVEAGERVRRLVERAQLQPRITLSYSSTLRSVSAGNIGADISDMAADARRELALIHRELTPDCAGIVIDVCGFLKGLQQVELERGWPRRSAKLVLRIALDQVAHHYGLGPFAQGRVSARRQSWLPDDAKPSRFE